MNVLLSDKITELIGDFIRHVLYLYSWLQVFEVCILQVGLTTKERKIPPCDYYYDMTYTLPYLTFSNVVNGKNVMMLCMKLPNYSRSLLFLLYTLLTFTFLCGFL